MAESFARSDPYVTNGLVTKCYSGRRTLMAGLHSAHQLYRMLHQILYTASPSRMPLGVVHRTGRRRLAKPGMQD